MSSRSTNASEPQLARCQDKVRRLNLKSKRKRNIVKKAIELSKMLDMDMLVVFKDKDTGKITQYTSGCKDGDLFTIEKAMEEINAWRYKGRTIKLYDDNDYSKLKPSKAEQGDDEDEEPTKET